MTSDVQDLGRPVPVIEGEVVDLDTIRVRRAGPDLDPDGPDDDGSTPGAAGTVLVDAAVGRTELGVFERWRAAQTRPLLPPWASSAEQLREAGRWAARYAWHVTRFHTLRAPAYATRIGVRAPVGAARLVVGLVRWTADAEGLPVRLAAVRREDAEQYLKLSRQRDARVRLRTWAAGLLLVLALAATVTVLLAPPAVRYGVLAVLVGVLGVVGRPADRPLLGRAVINTCPPRLTSDVVVRALGALGIEGINRALGRGGDGISFPAPISRDGPGWRADVDLPFGVTSADVMERRARLASGLRRPLGCVWPEPAHDQHAGRLVLWVGDADLATARPAPWPLARRGEADLFQPVPFGTDQRGRPVSVPLMYGNVLIGAMPGVGKTFALRVLLLAAALDVRAELRVFELKGSGDLAALEPVAHHYGSGPDDDTIAACVASLREVYRDLERRAKTIAGLPREQAPENKVTPALASRRSLGLHPLVVAVDECQELFAHPEFGREAGELCTAIIKRGRALGVILLLATQRPDKDSLPTGISANVGVRFCLRVMGQVENDMILGTSMYRNGVRATTFTNRDKGIGYLVGAAADPQIARSAYLDAPAAERVIVRARAAREAAGRLSGHAAGQDTAPKPAGSVLEDILAVVPAGEERVWSETVVERLAELRPDTYAGWGPEQLAAALKPHGVDTAQIGRRIDGRTVNRRGITRADITEAVAERNRRRAVG